MSGVGEFWLAQLISTGVCAALAATFCLHMRAVVRDILRDEKRRLRDWATREADRRAHERTVELLRHLRISVPVTLVNESDIAWGDDTKGQEGTK